MQECTFTINEVAGMLLESSLFRDFQTVDLRSVARYFRAVTINKGEIIFQEGDIGTFMCVVSAGNISVTKLDSDGHLVEKWRCLMASTARPHAWRRRTVSC
jgi:CRP-like cAMP-binding protein